MKKLLAILLTVMMLFSLTACGTEENDEKNAKVENPSLSDNTDTSNVLETENKSDISTGDYTWKDYLVDYEKWVDEYIVILKKHHENPSDLSILSDYSKMVQETAEWAERSEKIKSDIEDTSEMLEFSSELLKIASKITEATNEMVTD